MRSRVPFNLVCCFIMTVMPTVSLQGATFNVNTTTDLTDLTPGDGVCQTSQNNCSLRAAIQETNTLAGADIINLPAGTYALTIGGGGEDNAATGDLDIRQSVTLVGAGASTTIVQGVGDRVFQVPNLASPANVTIQNITITGGTLAGGDGAGIQTEPNSGSLIVERCVMTLNNANGGFGGGMTTRNNSTTLTGCTISNNTANANGGGLDNFAGTFVVSNCTVSGNSANGSGGGLINEAGAATLTNVTVAGNTADADNNGTGNGGGIAQTGGTINFNNTLIAKNVDRGGQAPDISGTLNSTGDNLIENPAGGTVNGIVMTNIINMDPLMGPLANNGGQTQTHALLTGSPAIDAGSGVGSDQRGIARPQGTASDIGAFELVTTPQPVCGNGSVESGEQCDDGNTANGDGCSATCTTETPAAVCGNSVIETGEQCDDGNTTSGDGCSATCHTETPVCGNGVVETGEECDGSANCTPQCQIQGCPGSGGGACGAGLMTLMPLWVCTRSWKRRRMSRGRLME